MKMTIDELFKNIIKKVNGEYATYEEAKTKFDKTIKCLELAGFTSSYKEYNETKQVDFKYIGNNPEEFGYFYGLTMWHSPDHNKRVSRLRLKGEKRTSMDAKYFQVEWFN